MIAANLPRPSEGKESVGNGMPLVKRAGQTHLEYEPGSHQCIEGPWVFVWGYFYGSFSFSRSARLVSTCFGLNFRFEIHFRCAPCAGPPTEGGRALRSLRLAFLPDAMPQAGLPHSLFAGQTTANQNQPHKKIQRADF